MRILILVLKLYQLLISPILPKACRYLPSCSDYAIEAIKVHRLYGLVLITKRLLKCNPFGGHGVDMVPKKKCDHI